MGRFHIYGHDRIPYGIIEKIESEQFITSTSATLSPSRHIFWEVMFAGFTSILFYKNDSNILEKILCTNLAEAKKCLEKFRTLKNNPFVIPKIISSDDIQFMVTRFIKHLCQRISGDFLLYNITEVLNTYDIAKTEEKLLNAICASKDFYTKILSGHKVTYREMFYALSGSPFKNKNKKESLVSCIVEKATLEEVYSMLSGVEDM